MAHTRSFYAKSIEEAEKKLTDAQQRLADIREKLERADARKKADPTQQARWNSIIDGLERELDKTKALIAHCEAEIRDKKTRMEEAPADPEPAAVAESTGDADDEDLNVALADLERLLEPDESVKRMLDMPPEELVSLSEDEIAALQDYEMKVARARRQTAEGETPRYVSPVQLRKQEKLRQALEKLRVDNFYGLTLDDMTIISEAYVTLNKIPKRSAQEEEMRFLIGGAIYSFETLYKYLQRWWDRAEGRKRKT